MNLIRMILYVVCFVRHFFTAFVVGFVAMDRIARKLYKINRLNTEQRMKSVCELHLEFLMKSIKNTLKSKVFSITTKKNNNETKWKSSPRATISNRLVLHEFSIHIHDCSCTCNLKSSCASVFVYIYLYLYIYTICIFNLNLKMYRLSREWFCIYIWPVVNLSSNRILQTKKPQFFMVLDG